MRTVFESAALLLKSVRSFSYPLDLRLSDFFKTRRLNQRERAFVAELIYTAVRHWRLIEWLVGKPTKDEAVLKIAAFLMGELPAVSSFLSDEEKRFFESFSWDFYKESVPPAVFYSFPDFLFDALKKRFGDKAFEVAALMNEAAPLDLRINPLKTKRCEVLNAFAHSCPTPFSPLGVRLKKKIPLSKNSLFLEGKIEVQDEGSQLVALLADAKRRQMVFDFCAGAGGKTLVLGALMKNTGTLYAADISQKRLARFVPRFKKSGLSNVQILNLNENSTRLKRLKNRFDRVLLDVPCSGSGTLRRNPDLKWRFSMEHLKHLNQTQLAILNQASLLLKSGGVLLYATCSFLKEENEEVVLKFLNENPQFERFSLKETAWKLKLNLPDEVFNENNELFLSPLLQTDCFFASALIKK